MSLTKPSVLGPLFSPPGLASDRYSDLYPCLDPQIPLPPSTFPDFSPSLLRTYSRSKDRTHWFQSLFSSPRANLTHTFRSSSVLQFNSNPVKLKLDGNPVDSSPEVIRQSGHLDRTSRQTHSLHLNPYQHSTATSPTLPGPFYVSHSSLLPGPL